MVGFAPVQGHQEAILGNGRGHQERDAATDVSEFSDGQEAL